MPITYPIQMPIQSNGSSIIKSYDLRMNEKIGVTTSAFNFKQQFQDYNASRWELSIKTIPLFGDDARNMRGLLQSLRGRLGTFLVNIPQNNGEPNPFVNMQNASIGNDHINVGNSSATALTFNRGTYFSHDNYLYMAMEDRPLSAGDQVITPRLRTPLTALDILYTTNPRGVFRLDNNDPEFAVSVNEGHTFSFTCHEVIP